MVASQIPALFHLLSVLNDAATFGCLLQVIIGDINVAVGTATYEELQRRFGEEKVKFLAFDVTDHKKFRGNSDIQLLNCVMKQGYGCSDFR